MRLEDKIRSLARLGIALSDLKPPTLEAWAAEAQSRNAWFTPAAVRQALQGIILFLDESELKAWTSRYDFSATKSKSIGVITAGNVPLVGFHDVLCVMLAGHRLALKASTDDTFLMTCVLEEWFKLAPELQAHIQIVERLPAADAFIATGSDNSARYFEYYFRGKPQLIRKNRTSVAVLTGEESEAELTGLGQDVFRYYGLGCRNVTQLFVPLGYDFTPLLARLHAFQSVMNHRKYRHNYQYNKAIYRMNKMPHHDTSFLLLRESRQIASPIAVLHYQTYETKKELQEMLGAHSSKIQIVVGNGEGQAPFGTAQKPRLWDYADGVDTLSFLLGL